MPRLSWGFRGAFMSCWASGSASRKVALVFHARHRAPQLPLYPVKDAVLPHGSDDSSEVESVLGESGGVRRGGICPQASGLGSLSYGL